MKLDPIYRFSDEYGSYKIAHVDKLSAEIARLKAENDDLRRQIVILESKT